MLHAHNEAIRHESRRRLSSLSLFTLFAVLIQTEIYAQWSTNPLVNNAISTTVRNQTEVKVASDGSGGAIIVWSENNYPDGSSNIYAQRINSYGKLAWGALGTTVCGAMRDQITPQIVSDGRGGAIIAWQDLRSGTNFDIYAQHLNESGSRQWAADGIPICTDPNTQEFVQLACDGDAGAIIVWYDNRAPASAVYAQHVSAVGVVLWTANGIPVSDPLHSADVPLITADMKGGAFIAWSDRHDTVSGDDIYAQRIDDSGALAWPLPGAPICTGMPNSRGIGGIAPDNNNGFFLSWLDTRSDTYGDLYAQHITWYGEIKWTANGKAICALPSIQRYTSLIGDGSGGMIVTWSDTRDTATGWDIYAQRVNSAGEIAWQANGIPVTTATNAQVFSKSTSDGAGGAIIAWKDYRSGVDIYAQRVNSNGQLLWDADGAAVSTAPGIQDAPEIVPTNLGGAIVAWMDYRASVGADIYAQNIEGDGGLGYRPHLVEVRDVPNDQGGRVVLLWNRSSLDTLAYGSITGTISGYNIYRGVTASMPAFRSTQTEASSGASGLYMTNGMRNTSGEPIYWEYLMNVSAAYHSRYSCTVPTLSDSGPHGGALYYYMVRAYYSSSIFWDSEPVTGSSIDNLSPLVMGTPAAQLMADGSIALHWTPGRQDTDIACYLVYRSSAPDFSADSSSCIGSCVDTSFIDRNPAQASTLFYRVAAQDRHGNIGQASPSVPLERTVTRAEEAGALPASYALEQNYPNPLNPSTVIRYALPASSYVRLMLYRSTGSEAATLFSGHQEAGYHQITFDASGYSSGMYFYRLQAGPFTAVRKMVIIH